ncbi:reprolysin-like metallopeptidase [Nocardioides sp. LHG3406-4]|uniref:reprolysin-like metallopeptidase n=1 Tax=Nocardioides sp. LHG3406-4 TaxID=2804575 RepID=UPI003CF4A005
MSISRKYAGLLVAAGVTLTLVAGLGPAGAAPDGDLLGAKTYEPGARLSPDDTATPPPAPTPRPRVRDQGYTVAPGDPRDTVDIAVIGTPAVISATGGQTGFATFAQSAVNQTNTAFANSGITTRLRLVAAAPTATPESTSVRTDLYAVQNPSDGRFDDVQAVREATHADIVHLLVEGSDTDTNGGYGFVGATPEYAYAVTHRDLATTIMNFAHETGHVFGADHDPATNPSAPLPARGYFYAPGRWHTIMSYPTACSAAAHAPCTVIPYFSNPAVSYQGVPTGTAEANNASVIETNAAAVAGFRQSQLYPVTPLVSKAVIGKKAKVDTGTWTPVASLAVQWYVDGKPIAGATKRTLKMKRKYVHKALSVAVTGTAASYAPLVVSSAPVEVTKKLLRKTRTPKIKGKAKAGKRLVARVKQSKPRSKLSFSWYSNGVKIKGAHGRSYKVKKKDRGTYIQVRVRFKKKGFEPVVKPSASTLVG